MPQLAKFKLKQNYVFNSDRYQWVPFTKTTYIKAQCRKI